jgi:hypothetical protein
MEARNNLMIGVVDVYPLLWECPIVRLISKLFRWPGNHDDGERKSLSVTIRTLRAQPCERMLVSIQPWALVETASERKVDGA